MFVILVVLLGIFFSMGYIAGKNGGGAAVATAKPADAGADKPALPDTAAQPPATTEKTSAAGAEVAAPKASAAGPPPAVETKPEPDTGRAELSDPEPGQTFLQVVATGEHDARAISQTLQKSQFPARLAPGPKGLVRVLVGPVNGAAELAKLRTELEAKGFSNPFVQKY